MASSNRGPGACGLGMDVLSEVTGAAIMPVRVESCHYFYPVLRQVKFLAKRIRISVSHQRESAGPTKRMAKSASGTACSGCSNDVLRLLLLPLRLSAVFRQVIPSWWQVALHLLPFVLSFPSPMGKRESLPRLLHKSNTSFFVDAIKSHAPPQPISTRGWD